LGVFLGAIGPNGAMAQQVTGTPGSPSATTTIEGNQLPPPPPKFGGVIKESAKDSTPWWPVVPPKGAPNVLLIMTDDQGYGVSPTSALDRIAYAGLRYTQFHSTALCSPTRAALITGRNHHSAGFGVIAELSTGYPGYDSIIGPENASIGRILSDNGYATSWFGKNHNTPGFQYSLVRPFDQWPSGMGFQYLYGFMGGKTDQWTPYLFRDHTQIFPWIGKPGYNLLREQIFANQKRLGVIPANAKLTPWPDELPQWDSLSLLQKKLYARQSEVFAAYTAYTDHEIGRVIQAVEEMGKLDRRQAPSEKEITA
jgi:arylsulfatase